MKSVTKQLTAAALLLLGTTQAFKHSSNDQFLLVVEVSRHGAREASKIYNFTADPNANFNGTSNLTPFGKEQHFKWGQKLKERYIDTPSLGFLEPIFNEDDIEIRSTYLNRTYLSATYQLMGMFPENQPRYSDYHTYEIGNEDYLSPKQKTPS